MATPPKSKPATKAEPKLKEPKAKAEPKAKPAGAAKAAPKAAAKPARAAAAKPKVEAAPAAAVAEAGAKPVGLRMKDLIDQVAERSGAKKADAKPVLEAAFAILGEALARGEGFVLPGLGKGKVARSKAAGEAEVMTLKLKRGAEKNATTPLADADE